MSVKAGQSSNTIPRPDLWEAMSYLTGGAWQPNEHDLAWKGLHDRLVKSSYSGFEYCYWLMHFSGNSAFASEVLYMRNLATSLPLWSKFMQFKEVLPKRLRVQVHLDKDILYTAFRHESIAEALLSKAHEVSAPMRVEFALQRSRLGDFDAEPILLVWGLHAGEVLMALPEYLEHTPRIVDNMEKPDVSRFLFPQSD